MYGHGTILGGQADGVVGAVHLQGAAVAPRSAALRRAAGNRGVSRGFEAHAGTEVFGQRNRERTVDGARFQLRAVPGFGGQLQGDGPVLRIQVHLAAIARKRDRTIGGVRFHGTAAIGDRDGSVGGTQFDAAIHAAHLDGSIFGFQIQGCVARRMHDEHGHPVGGIGGWPVIRDSSGGVRHGDAAHHLFRHGLRLRRCDLAGFHRIIGAIPAAHTNLSAIDRIQLKNRRLTLAHRKVLVHLGGFTAGAHFQFGAALGVAVDVEIEAPILSRVRLAGGHQPPETKHRCRNIEEAFVFHT